MFATALPTPSNTFLPILLEAPLATSRAPTVRPYAAAPVDSFAPGQEVVGEGDVAGSYYQVVSGLFRTVKFTPDGRRQVFAFYGPGDLIGLDAHGIHEATVEAVNSGALAVYSRKRFETAMQVDARLALSLFRAAADALRRAIAHMTVIGRSSAVERVAWFLIDAASRFGLRSKGALQCTLVMSRRDIADYLGLTIETISRTLTLLKQSDIIQLRTSRLVEIRKPDLLRKLAAADRDDAAIRRLLP